ncbi:CBU_0592 family membrane protein [Ruegeria sp.]|uniref:CBU_0592 family membrane protein n=1 Tax=Ruegeria sp. TaxID=1879320 RepID=UPI003C7A66C6
MTALLDNLTIVDAIGSFGALIVVAAYFATQMRMMNSDDLAFPVVNLLGSVLIVYSLVYNFNLASMLIEGFWILISLIGIIQHFRLRRAE